MSTSKVLIVGAGLTGSLTAALLRRQCQSIDLTVWEKSRGAGGRMTTARSPDGCSGRADTGAQYISAKPQYFTDHNSFYKELLATSTLVPFTGVIDGEVKQDGVKHFVAPNGTSAIAKYFLQQSGAKVCYQTHCTDITANSTKLKCTDMEGKQSVFDSVIVTIPVPQILGLTGTIHDLAQAKRELFDDVKYSSRYALALFYAPGIKGVDFPWTAKYVTGDECIRFACVDSKKRQQDSSVSGTSIVLHSSVPFGIKHLESDRQEVENIMLKHTFELFPNLPKPTATKCQKWRYSQVSQSVKGMPGSQVLMTSPLLVVGGDAFTHSNFDGCVDSAMSIVRNFTK
ncbi:predicted protein [Nematostella vectensis]|uniref:Amine oxidase domain-containing protein n=2 Tax=Nematostella vectensis TaxID=45351 RepID=A7SGJ0_NEMVE|nr:predicted protein [Nematostella vectensis]|eukprot:XP_001629208.1 predicted protein [Nematostella vectensis]